MTRSRERSEACEKQIVAQLGGGSGLRWVMSRHEDSLDAFRIKEFKEFHTIYDS